MKFATIAAIGLVLIAPRARADEPKPKEAARDGAQGTIELKDVPREKGKDKAAVDPKDAAKDASYGIGLNLGRTLKKQSAEVDAETLARGLRDGLSGAKPMLTDAQITEALRSFQAQVTVRQQEMAKVEGEKSKKDGDAFLAANAKKEGVKTLPSGLQYKVLKAGAGKSPKAADTVTVHYTGTLTDGTKFDSSEDRGQPASFQVNQVIPGWTKALQKMKVGDRWQIVIPSNLAYGERPRPGGPIPPNATLIFNVELLGIE